ncbi:hypothetical protein XA68_15904 [Ophiocordyceps unilateralis]|uniref:Uncharacterized protein n=1 Tax=Ophiocordyceps unilateralis TaxID=268505 RepID=A0A2A9PKJ8_OPHUN|nr:hypothetical protein XA68_15904 [Ophiocordyceps unilateralis]
MPSRHVKGGSSSDPISPSLADEDQTGASSASSSSPPDSVIEVPASSPFQSRLGSRIAPAGTYFRPPRPAATMTAVNDTISLLSEDDDQGRLADIRPTSFKAKVAAYTYSPSVARKETMSPDEEIQKRMKQIWDVFGHRYSAERVREALLVCHNDLDDAIIWLQSSESSGSAPQKPPASRRLVSKATMKREARKPAALPPLPNNSPSPPKPTRRRLIQGLRNRNATPRSADPPSSDDPLIVENEKDAFRVDDSPEPAEDDAHGRVLASINSSSLAELVAMTGLKENFVEPLVAKRPFADLDQARRVSISKKSGSRKAAKVGVGESVVDAVSVFLRAVSAIDDVVGKCEVKAQMVKAVVDAWELDSFGFNKRSGRATPDRDMPPTPTSLGSSRYTRPLVPQQPRLMDGHCEMKPFQLFGLNWLALLYNYRIGCILADEMGLGKTCQVISFICHLVEDYERQGRGRRPWPNLVVVPPSTYNNWLIEFERFAPDLSVIGYRGSQSERAGIVYDVLEEPEAYHVVLATYSQINSETDVDAMQRCCFNAAIFDEGHKMKNSETKIYQDLRQIPAAWKMLLTGTPVQNNLLEMTSLLSFINPRMFEGCMQHVQYIFSQKISIRDVSNGAFLYNERVRRARTILEPFILQRRKDQVLSSMPRKYNTLVRCEMSEAQRPVYDEYEKLFKTEPSQRGVEASRGRQNDQNNVWMQLRKAALHPLLFRRHFTDAVVEKMGKVLMKRVPQAELHQPDLGHLIQELKNSSDFELHLWCRDYPQHLRQYDLPASAELDSGKVKKLLELVTQYQAKGDRALVFSKFSRIIELLQEALALRGIDHRVLMGNTKVTERQTLIDEFNSDPSIAVFLLTTGAGGTGINLTAANKVIIFDQSENPQDDIQAENRAHRLGQTRDVEVIRLISSGTMEELMYKACQKKIELANKVTGADGHEERMEAEVRKLMDQEMTPV